MPRPRQILLTWVLCLLQLLSVQSDFLNVNFNTKKDWISGIEAKGPHGCMLSPQAKKRPMPTCGPVGPNSPSVQQIREQGWRLAPRVYMHPREWSRLTDPKAYMEKSTIYDPLDLTPESLYTNRTLQQTYQYLTVLGANYFISDIYPNLDQDPDQKLDTETLKSRIGGDPLDENGLSTAKVWYTAMDATQALKTFKLNYSEGEAVIFKFHYFYPYNGCSNQLFAMNLDAKYQGIEYYMCPEGTHEGDWEHISMLVCVADWDDTDPTKAIKRIQYSAHAWNNQYDCDLGECNFETDTQGAKRLVAYSGLFSHAMYPQPSPLWVYFKVSAELLLNIDGVYFGDRTSREGGLFEPTANNTLLLPFMVEMTEEDIRGQYAWAAFPGSWGGPTPNTPGSGVTCFSNNFTTEGKCPADNPAAAFLKYFLNLNLSVPGLAGALVGTVSDLTWSVSVKPPVVVDATTGPLMRQYTYQWEEEGTSPMWDNPSTISCPFSGDPTVTKSFGADYEETDIVGFVLGVVLLMIGTGCLFGLVLWCLPGLHKASDFLLPLLVLAKPPPREVAQFRIVDPLDSELPSPVSPTMAYHPAAAYSPASPSMPYAPAALLAEPTEAALLENYQATRHFGWMLLGLAIYVTGGVLTIIGIDAIFQALRMIYNLTLYATVYKALVVVLVVFGTWQLVVLMLSLMVRNQQYLRLACVRLRNPFASWGNATRVGRGMQVVLASVHVIAANSAMLLFAFGGFITIARMVFQIACNSVLKALFAATPAASVCLDLNALGIDRVICGSDLAMTCGRWHGLHVEYVCWGALLILMSHMLYLSMSVHQYASLMNLQATMDHLGLQPAKKAKTSRPVSMAGTPEVGITVGEDFELARCSRTRPLL